MKQAIKRALYTLAPRWAAEFFSARSRAHSHRIVKTWDSERINGLLISHLGREVVSGPFHGLKLIPETEKEFLGPFLLGTFESELHPWIEAICRRGYSAFIDVGSKFGYYSVGLAMRCRNQPSIAFDTDRWARKVTRQMAVANGVSNVEVKGFCDRGWIANKLPADSVILSDCEGYESVLFEKSCTSLETTTLIIETHDREVPGVTDKLKNTFKATHDISEVASGTRRISPTDLSFLPTLDRDRVIYEARNSQVWLLMVPKERQLRINRSSN